MGKAESRQQSGKPNNTLEKQLKTAIEKKTGKETESPWAQRDIIQQRLKQYENWVASQV